MLSITELKEINRKLAKKLQLQSCPDDANIKTLIEANNRLVFMLQLRSFERPFTDIKQSNNFEIDYDTNNIAELKTINKKLAKKLQLQSCPDDANIKTLIKENNRLEYLLILRKFETPFSSL